MNTNGYIEDTPLPDRFLGFSNPHYQRYVALTQGYVPAMNENFSYVELGCGSAFTLCVNAAANPNATFMGVDSDPKAIEAGDRRIKNLGLKNIQLRHQVISDSTDIMNRLFEAEEIKLPEADFVFCHGLLSQVSPEIRNALFEVIGAILRPGGIAFASYDSLPGSEYRQTIHHIAQSYRDAISDDKERVETAFGFLNFLYLNKSHFTLQNDIIIDDITAGVCEPDATTHHFGNEHYTPLWFADVSKEMNEQGLFFCGSTEAANNNPRLMIPDAALNELGEIADVESWEFVKDMFTNMDSRTDLYIRPMQTDLVVGEVLARMRFTLIAPRKLVVTGNNARVGYVELEDSVAGPILDKLVRGDALTNLAADVFHTLVGISKAIVPEVRGKLGINANVHRAFIDDQLGLTGSFVTVISGQLGTGFIVPKEAMLLYLCGSHGAAQKWVAGHHTSITKDTLAVAVKHRDDYAALIKRLAPDL
jgi:SAM-dependent methyltransferase